MHISPQHTASVVASAARTALEQLAHHVGAGRHAMSASPALLALVDQHAADIRDTLGDGRGQLHAEHLAAYADGVTDAAAHHGWHLTDALAEGWARASWPLVRLLAVSTLADA